MADKQVRIRLSETGAEQTAAAIGKVDGAMSGLARQAVAVGAAYFSAAGIINALRFGTNAARDQEQANRLLAASFKGPTKGMLDWAASMQKTTGVSDNLIVRQQAFLAALNFSEEQIKQITKAALGLNLAFGMELSSGVRNLAKTYSGLSGELGELIPQFRSLTSEQLKAGEAVKIAGDLTESSLTKAKDSLTDFQNQWEDFLENTARPIVGWLSAIGKAVSYAVDLGPIDSALDTSIDKVKEWTGELVGSNAALVSVDEQAIKTSREIRAAWVVLSDEQQRYQDALKGTKADQDAMTKAWEGWADRVKELAAARWASIEADVQQIRIAEEVNARRAEGFRLLEEIASLEGESLYDIEALTEAQTAWNDAEDVWLSNMDRRVEAIGQEVEMTMQLRQAKLMLASATLGSLAQINQAFKGSFLLTKRAMQAQAVVDTFAAANRNLATYPLPLGAILAAAAVVQGLANVATIQSQGFASGGYISGHGGTRSDSVPAMLSRGEGVLNAATVARIGGESAIHALNAGAKMGGGVTIQFNGPITDRDYVRDFIVPEIRKAVSRA